MYIVPLKYSVFAETGVNYIDFSNFWAYMSFCGLFESI